MTNPLDPNEMDSQERLSEAAEILAAGIMRRRMRHVGKMAHMRKIREAGLDSSPEASVHGHEPEPKGERL